jgi:hypothetical protein
MNMIFAANEYITEGWAQWCSGKILFGGMLLPSHSIQSSASEEKIFAFL